MSANMTISVISAQTLCEQKNSKKRAGFPSLP